MQVHPGYYLGFGWGLCCLPEEVFKSCHCRT